MVLDHLKKKALVYDIETCATNPETGLPIDIITDFDNYIKYAKAKWFGCYSYKYETYYGIEIIGNEDHIRDFIQEHDILIGFNSIEFDTPILLNNNLLPDKKFNEIDCKVILGSSSFYTPSGTKFKNRGALMGLSFKKNNLRTIAADMDLETQKGDIDYRIFFQDVYTTEQRSEIEKYLENDVMATKQMFDKLWDYWLPFTEFLSVKNINNLSWIKSSISSLAYKIACNHLGVEDTYGEKVAEEDYDSTGARVIEPKFEEVKKVWYVDFTSLYPHMFAMFNLFAEVDMTNAFLYNKDKIWHGNDVFKVKGYYDISKHHPLSADFVDKLKMRAHLKKTDPKNPLQYAIKIYLNSSYGAARSPVFEKIHTPNCGSDCCYLGQQVQILTEIMMGEMGFQTVAGDTDSLFMTAKEEQYNNKEYVEQCLAKVIDKIKANAPFPAETFDIKIEHYIDYIMWPFSMQPIVEIDEEGNKSNKKEKNRLIRQLKGKKKNYVYIYTDKKGEKQIEIMGLPVIKDGHTELGNKILNDVLIKLMLDRVTAKFERSEIDTIIDGYLKQPGSYKLLAREYKAKQLSSYANPNVIYAQISKEYFNGVDGIIELIKNNKCGKVGKSAKYCTIQEAEENKLTIENLDLKKLYNELEPFTKNDTTN